MADKNLLAVLKIEDETFYLLKDFFESLPKETEKVFHSLGYVGNLEENLNQFKVENTRQFFIFRSPDFGKLNKTYFTETPEARCSELPDKLIVKMIYKQQDTNLKIGAKLSSTFEGSIDEMIEKYNELASTQPLELLEEGLIQSEFLRKNMTKKRLVGKRKIVPTYISVGVETPDGKYLLKTTGAQGPYGTKP